MDEEIACSNFGEFTGQHRWCPEDQGRNGSEFFVLACRVMNAVSHPQDLSAHNEPRHPRQVASGRRSGHWLQRNSEFRQ